jgi:hypothetical protein
MHDTETRSVESCARLCHECQDECLTMMRPCLELGGRHAGPEHQTLLLDCAETCRLCENLIHRHSEHAAVMCRGCAEICRACAASCRDLAAGGEGGRHERCAETCKRCAEACEQVVATAA